MFNIVLPPFQVEYLSLVLWKLDVCHYFSPLFSIVALFGFMKI